MGNHTSELLSAPHARNLSTLAAVKEEINLGVDTSNDAFLLRLLGQATGEVEGHLGYPLYRAHVRESFAGDGGTELQLDRRPVRLLTEVAFDGAALPLTGFDILAPELGLLVAVYGWSATVRRDWAVSYWGGWLLPSDDMADAAFTAAGVDKSFNDAAGRFPILLPGEWVVAGAGWNVSNQGLRRVVTGTASKIVVEETLVDDSVGAVKALGFSTLPDPLERACLEHVKIRFHGRDRDPALKRGNLEGFIDESFDVEAALKRVSELTEPFVRRVPSLVVRELVRA